MPYASHHYCFYYFLIPHYPRSTLFPYTTLFRSLFLRAGARQAWRGGTDPGRAQAGGREPGRLLGLPERARRSEEHTSELQSLRHLVCRLLLEKKKLSSFPLGDVAAQLGRAVCSR